jgi:ORF6N domain
VKARGGRAFPQDFMFQLDDQEQASLRSQIATLKTGRGQHRKYAPFAFTEHGAIMAATVLNSPRAVHQDLAKQWADLQDKTESLAAQHGSLSRTTHTQLKEVFDALRQLVVPPDPPRRPIGFVTPQDKTK